MDGQSSRKVLRLYFVNSVCNVHLVQVSYETRKHTVCLQNAQVFLTLQNVVRVITTRLYEVRFIQCSLILYPSNRSLSAEVALTEVCMGNMAVLSAILSVLRGLEL